MSSPVLVMTGRKTRWTAPIRAHPGRGAGEAGAVAAAGRSDLPPSPNGAPAESLPPAPEVARKMAQMARRANPAIRTPALQGGCRQNSTLADREAGMPDCSVRYYSNEVSPDSGKFVASVPAGG